MGTQLCALVGGLRSLKTVLLPAPGDPGRLLGLLQSQGVEWPVLGLPEGVTLLRDSNYF